MQATAIAQPNIALIKYWGKRDIARNLPAVGSISITLSELHTEVSVDLNGDQSADVLFVNDAEDSAMLPRISACLDRVLGSNRPHARVRTRSNFPIAAGLASSASAFAATTVAAAGAANLSLGTQELAQLAGASSGSAARSLYGGFTELANSGDGIALTSLRGGGSWPMQVVVAITAPGPKAMGSTEAMEISRESSPFYKDWVSQQEHDLTVARTAIAGKDFTQLTTIAEHNCLKMHSLMWASRPPTVFWNAATMRCLQTVRRLQGEGCQVFFTIDAGPQVKAICLPDDAEAVRQALAETPGVQEIMMTGLGSAARLLEEQ